jgi:hypothetical protein
MFLPLIEKSPCGGQKKLVILEMPWIIKFKGNLLPSLKGAYWISSNIAIEILDISGLLPL